MDYIAPKALLFDWDDTITRNWWRVFQSMNKTLLHMGYSEWNEDEAFRRLGASGRDVFPQIFGDKWEDGSKAYYSFLDETLHNAPEPLLGAVEAIRRLSDETDFYLAVLSNKRGDYLREEVKKLGLNDCFGQIIGSGDAKADKPAKDAMEMVLDGSGLTSGSDIWFIGDSHTDMQCAHDNSCTAVMIETKKPPEDMLYGIEPHISFDSCSKLAEYIFDNFSDKTDLILSQTQCR